MPSHDPQTQDPRGSRGDAGQGGDKLGGSPECPFCGATVTSFALPDHFVDEHAAEVSEA